MRISNYSKYFLLAAVCCGVMNATQAQFVTNYKKAADDYYAKGDYNSAATYYEKYIGAKPGAKDGYDPYIIQKQGSSGSSTDRSDIFYRIGESYRNLTYYSSAEPAYKQVVDKGAAKYPLARYWYAVCLRADGKYQEAQQQLEQFIADYSADDVYKKQAKQELENCKFIQQQLASGSKTSVQKLDSGVNKEGASYAAAWVNDNTLSYTSTRGTYTNHIYVADAGLLSFNGLDKGQQGAAAFSADGKQIYFTAWDAKAGEGKKITAIYTAKKAGNAWGQPVLMSNTVNDPSYSSRQPFVTADGKYLLFASDRPGGMGKFDIWYVLLNANGTTGKAVNAGNVINTVEDEEAPFYHQASGKLIFASNGRTGMGGFDLYESKGTPEAKWEAVVNLGAPINSVKDDIYLISKQDKELLAEAMISSDRSSACCLELFAVSKPIEVIVKEPVKEEPPVVVAPQETPKPQVVVEDNKALLQHVLFELNSSELDEAGQAQLKEVAVYLQNHPDVKVEIGAHTDATGTKELNLKLSQSRADACVKYLAGEGIDAKRLTAKGYGDCCPLEKETADDGRDNPDARAKNRRVEMKVL
ncbi:Outer membrane protein OmpA [Filimonas lacunae]|uniref:Outer membrane protein OmpA n=1 Tax=Filimonas lacunae TaxID=477680 RepID=A0A173MM40_9BACT|nr:OmpA family protein [Filimonas lacunae]BAV08702.1 outer membrane lipoprotein omp16 precursor [Filimonas lacunae]SIS60273.1 Outer membrane protein OmpA [Filimonas lacunae]